MPIIIGSFFFKTFFIIKILKILKKFSNNQIKVKNYFFLKSSTEVIFLCIKKRKPMIKKQNK